MTADNPIVPELFFGMDDRKTLLDVYYSGGGVVSSTQDLRRDVYPGLIAVANHAAVEAVNYECDVETQCQMPGLGWGPCSVEGCKNPHRTRNVSPWVTK